MKIVNVHGIKMSTTEEMAFSKFMSNNNIAMNTKTINDRLSFVSEWLQNYLKSSK